MDSILCVCIDVSSDDALTEYVTHITDIRTLITMYVLMQLQITSTIDRLGPTEYVFFYLMTETESSLQDVVF
jgi:hypothetical protein